MGALGIPGLEGGRLVVRDKYTGGRDDAVHITVEDLLGIPLAGVIVPIEALARAVRWAQADPNWESINVNLESWPR